MKWIFVIGNRRDNLLTSCPIRGAIRDWVGGGEGHLLQKLTLKQGALNRAFTVQYLAKCSRVG